jgi:radical SAM superfamily enzyme YgiQ (UPF0313 family)
VSRPVVVLLNPPARGPHMRDQYCSVLSKAGYWPPVDLVIQSGFLARHLDCVVVDAVADRMSPDDCIGAVLAAGAQAVLALTGSATLGADLRFLARLRTYKRLTVVACGGALRFHAAEYLAEHPALDAILLDSVSPDLADWLAGLRQGPFYGLWLRDCPAEPATPSPSLSLPLPRHGLFRSRGYVAPFVRRYPFVTTLASAGCPHRCGFCVAARLPYQVRSPEEVIAELRAIRAQGFREVLFRDFTFGARRAWLQALCEQVIRADLGLGWTAAMRAEQVDEATARLLARAGCHLLLLGLESANGAILARHGKPTSAAVAERACRAARDAGIAVAAHFILGLPGETAADVERTIAWAQGLGCTYAAINFAVPQVGTRLRETCLAEGWTDGAINGMEPTTGRHLLGTPLLSAGELTALGRRALRAFYGSPRQWWRIARSVRSVRQGVVVGRHAARTVWGMCRADRDGV